jgi:hypothetical protein
MIKKFNFKQALIEIGVSEVVASDWMEVRKKKKASNTETAFNAILEEIKKSNINPNQCITEAVARSWQGFKASWIINQQQNGTTNNKPNMDDRLKQAVERLNSTGSEPLQGFGGQHEPFSDFETI